MILRSTGIFIIYFIMYFIMRLHRWPSVGGTRSGRLVMTSHSFFVTPGFPVESEKGKSEEKSKGRATQRASCSSARRQQQWQAIMRGISCFILIHGRLDTFIASHC